MASLYFVTFPPYHMYPKDFTIDCIINTVPEPAPSSCANAICRNADFRTQNAE